MLLTDILPQTIVTKRIYNSKEEYEILNVTSDLVIYKLRVQGSDITQLSMSIADFQMVFISKT